VTTLLPVIERLRSRFGVDRACVSVKLLKLGVTTVGVRSLQTDTQTGAPNRSRSSFAMYGFGCSLRSTSCRNKRRSADRDHLEIDPAVQSIRLIISPRSDQIVLRPHACRDDMPLQVSCVRLQPRFHIIGT
jgi:hypothetical protein